MTLPSLLVLALLLASGCGSRPDSTPNVTMRFTTAAGAVYHCMDAKVSRLGPDGASGYSFVCPGDGDATLEVIHGPGPSGPVITSITLKPGVEPRPAARVVLAADSGELAALGLPACAEAGRDQARFQAGLPTKNGRLAYGNHPVRLAYPCGEGILQVGKPLNQR